MSKFESENQRGSQAYEELHELRLHLAWEIQQVSDATYDFMSGVWKFPALDHFSMITRRLLVRSMFAAIEGTVFAVKQFALHAAPTDTLTLAEQSLCADVSYSLKDNGEAKEDNAKLRFASNLQFGLLVLAKSHGFSFSINKNSTGWNELLMAEKLRGRLMHPKRPTDLVVTDSEMASAIRGFQWAEARFHELMHQVYAFLKAEIFRLREACDRIEADTAQIKANSARINVQRPQT